jgi:hypothetical protein
LFDARLLERRSDRNRRFDRAKSVDHERGQPCQQHVQAWRDRSIAHGRYPAAAYNLFSIGREADGWRCEHGVRGLDDALRMQDMRQGRLI